MCRLLFLLIISLCICLCACSNATRKKVCFKNGCILAEVADTDFKRDRGLMFRKALSDNEGMLFIFEESEIYSFWMKNMHFALDVIWISQDKRIVDITANVLPCTATCKGFSPKEQVKYALEVNSGFATRHKMRIGETLYF